ncbi:PTS sugar transporter subunit IIA [Hyphomicrobium sp.]|uniref:PTS sugar transporter subunit IIA n=1 Tax=Hyphomicrobium sp. TaxID=82 RepID=UPI002E380E2B|nr:PTS sugar transporter subunit IIA [Hyphomicrobium sp.]HEX2842733.1 PTS sugar transporter subunit IIA [Hyphomicrobium sp.]
MEVRDFLKEADTEIDLRAADKSSLIKALAVKAASAVKLPADTIFNALQQRDELGSTGIGSGVCIPHARFREIQRPFGIFARLRHPIDFDAIDGEPVDLAFLLLLPAASQLDQLNALAAVARKLRDPEMLRRLRKADGEAAFYEAIAK